MVGRSPSGDASPSQMGGSRLIAKRFKRFTSLWEILTQEDDSTGERRCQSVRKKQEKRSLCDDERQLICRVSLSKRKPTSLLHLIASLYWGQKRIVNASRRFFRLSDRVYG